MRVRPPQKPRVPGIGRGFASPGRRADWGSLWAPHLARHDDLVVLDLLVERTARGTGGCADRAADDGPDGPADDRAGDRAGRAAKEGAAGFLVTVRDAGRALLLDGPMRLDGLLRDGLALDDSILGHDSVSL